MVRIKHRKHKRKRKMEVSHVDIQFLFYKFFLIFYFIFLCVGAWFMEETVNVPSQIVITSSFTPVTNWDSHLGIHSCASFSLFLSRALLVSAQHTIIYNTEGRKSNYSKRKVFVILSSSETTSFTTISESCICSYNKSILNSSCPESGVRTTIINSKHTPIAVTLCRSDVRINSLLYDWFDMIFG